MKKMIIATLCLISAGALAEENTFSMEIKDGKLSEAVELINGFCESEIGKISVKNPEEKLSIKFEGTNCKEASKIIIDYDLDKA